MGWGVRASALMLAFALGAAAPGGGRWDPDPGRDEAPVLRVSPAPGTVALTFDDGPSPDFTVALLDLLDRLQVRATFFVIGWRVEEHPDIVAEMARRGHSVQVHGFFHTPFTALSDAGIREQIERTAGLIHAVTGVWPTCVRPPYGAISPRVRRVVEGMGYRVVRWTVNSLDTDYRSATVVELRLRRVAAGSNVLGHDTLPLWLDALPAVVADFRGRDIGLSAICETGVMVPRPAAG